MIKTILPAFALASLVPSATMAGQVIKVPPFQSLALHGGGNATLRHGDRQRIVLIKGDPSIAEIRVTGDGRLMLSPCRHTCWGDHELEVEITTPSIAALSVHGGGDLKAERGFPKQPSLSLSVHGGGDADVRAIPADTVSVEVHGGGDSKVRAERSLAANVHGGGDAKVRAERSLAANVHGGGGDVRFWGHPQVVSSTHGGGSVESGE